MNKFFLCVKQVNYCSSENNTTTQPVIWPDFHSS